MTRAQHARTGFRLLKPHASVSCAQCHTPTLMTGNSSVDALRNKAVNLFSDAASQLTPLDRVTLPPARAFPAAQSVHRGFLQIWPWVALVALILVLAEWLAFHRGL